MTDREFELMDELYFVQSFQELQEECDMDEQELKQLLKGLVSKGWVRWMTSRSDENPESQVFHESLLQEYYYLATKAGLLAHNSR